jgi:hypothetical protein
VLQTAVNFLMTIVKKTKDIVSRCKMSMEKKSEDDNEGTQNLFQMHTLFFKVS